jgi:hypothetical protein
MNMAKVPKHTKVLKTLRFLLGLRRPEAHGPLRPYGLTQVQAATELQLREARRRVSPRRSKSALTIANCSRA